MTKKKRKKSSVYRTERSMASHLLEGLQEAERLARRRRWDEARDVLEDLNQRYPRQPGVLTELVNVYYELRDIVRYQWACQQLLEVDPDNAEAALGIAGAHMTQVRPALALRAFRHFIERWPDHARAPDVREMVANLEERLPSFFEDEGITGEAGWEIALLHEEMQVALDQGHYRECRRAAEALLQHDARFAPAYNNLSMAHFAEGHLDKAMQAAQQVLSFEPDNVHALSNMARFLVVSGRLDEARAYTDRLKASTARAWEVWLKKAEALTFVGDDAGVLEIVLQAEQVDEPMSEEAQAFLAHLAGVAALRLGRQAEARRYWEQALKHQPGFTLAKENLADVRRAVGERHAPWPFPLDNWLSPHVLGELRQVLDKLSDRRAERTIDRFLHQHTSIATAVPLLLERGDPAGRSLALLVAKKLRTPELLDVLARFALSQNGPDQMRMEAARVANEAGTLPMGLVRMWLKGEWRDVMLLGFEIHDEPASTHSAQVGRLLEESVRALHEGDGQRAEQLLKQALEAEPGAPDLLNNLASAYDIQGRRSEAEALLREIHAQHPDYVFARIGLSRCHVERGEFEAAQALLDPILQRRRIHYEELDAVYGAHIHLFLAQGKLDVARSWFKMWESVNPANPKLELFRSWLHPSGGWGLGGLLRRWARGGSEGR